MWRGWLQHFHVWASTSNISISQVTTTKGPCENTFHLTLSSLVCVGFQPQMWISSQAIFYMVPVPQLIQNLSSCQPGKRVDSTLSSERRFYMAPKVYSLLAALLRDWKIGTFVLLRWMWWCMSQRQLDHGIVKVLFKRSNKTVLQKHAFR